MFKIDDIIVEAGDIQIESITGYLRDDSFMLYLNTVEKYAEVDSEDDNVAYLFVGEETRKHGLLIGIENKKKDTKIQFPKNWIVHAFSGRYCALLIGIRRPTEHEQEVNVPFIQIG